MFRTYILGLGCRTWINCGCILKEGRIFGKREYEGSCWLRIHYSNVVPNAYLSVENRTQMVTL